MTQDERLKALQSFHGTPQHTAILETIRGMLTAAVAELMQPDWQADRAYKAHTRATELLRLLTDLRLDKIDVDVLSQGVVSQIDTILPTRIQITEEYLNGLREQAEQGTD